jgi:hypothetical protein
MPASGAASDNQKKPLGLPARGVDGFNWHVTCYSKE